MGVGVGGKKRGAGTRDWLHEVVNGDCGGGSEDAVMKEDAAEASGEGEGEGERAPIRSSSSQVWKK